MNHDNQQRLLDDIQRSLQVMESYLNAETEHAETLSLLRTVHAATLEQVRINPNQLEELWDVKHLHDRIHTIVVSLRVSRNNLERLEQQADACLQSARELIRSVEEPEDHEL